MTRAPGLAASRPEERRSTGPGQDARRHRSRAALLLLAAAAVILVATFAGLGIWQIARRAAKLDLIARVEARVHAAPAPVPAKALWPRVSAADDEYRRVAAAGSFRNDRDTLVQAVTELGPGFWVLTPLRTDEGFTVLVNRGFVPSTERGEATRMARLVSGRATVGGLLRMSEPGGGFLRSNDPAADRWYSRDVAAIAAARGLGETAPYFIDADAAPDVRQPPIGGLTIVTFHNSHLVYALTWFSLALLTTGGMLYAARDEWRLRQARSGGS